jgi:hypothetical protein
MRAREFVTEVELAWSRTHGTSRGGVPKLKYRCTTGIRKSRTVSHPSDCFDHPNVAKSQKMKTTRARTAPTQARRATRTKQINTATKLVSKLNKQRS